MSQQMSNRTITVLISLLVIIILSLSMSGSSLSTATKQTLKGRPDSITSQSLVVETLVINADVVNVESKKNKHLQGQEAAAQCEACPVCPAVESAPSPAPVVVAHSTKEEDLYNTCHENSKETCKSYCQGDKPCIEKCCSIRVFFGVITKASNSERREAVRQTWMTKCPGQAQFFMLATEDSGIPLEENKKYRDMTYLPYVNEGYFEIMHQVHTIFMVGSASKQFTHVMKVDDDSMVDCNLLIPQLASKPFEGMVLGTTNDYYDPDRNTYSKWYINYEEFPETRGNYPWVNGPGYVYTRDVAELVSFGVVQLRKFFKLEDIGMARLMDYVNHNISPVKYLYGENFIRNDVPCERPNTVVNHYVGAADMICYFKNNRKCNC